MLIDQAMILAAGFGKRLHPLTLTVPKPLICVNQKPIIDYTIDHLRQANIRRCIVNTHYLGDQIHHHLQTILSPEITISHEQTLLDTGGGIRHVLDFFQDTPFFVVNADIWWEDRKIFDHLRKFWDSRHMDGLLVMVPHEQTIDFNGPGDYFLTKDHHLIHRGQKPRAPYIYAGIQLLHPQAFQDMPSSAFHLMDVYRALEQKNRLYGLVLSGPWCDMGTPHALAQLEKHLQS